MMRVRKNDTVVVLTGKDKGKRGAVLDVDLKQGKVIVKGVAVVTRHAKAKRAGETSGIRKQEGSVELSNVMPVCASCDKACRVNFIVSDDNSKVRSCNRCKAAL